MLQLSTKNTFVDTRGASSLSQAVLSSSPSLPSSQGSGPSSPSKEVAGLNSKKVQALVPLDQL